MDLSTRALIAARAHQPSQIIPMKQTPCWQWCAQHLAVVLLFGMAAMCLSCGGKAENDCAAFDAALQKAQAEASTRCSTDSDCLIAYDQVKRHDGRTTAVSRDKTDVFAARTGQMADMCATRRCEFAFECEHGNAACVAGACKYVVE